jgi:glutamate synthase domain-containing protein 2/DNA-directed RNA polymerase subunit RPC12/RpoP
MAKYKCSVCGYIYDEEKEKIRFDELPADWRCPSCGSPKSVFEKLDEKKNKDNQPALSVDQPPQHEFPSFEPHTAEIHEIARTGISITAPMRTENKVISWDDILIKGAQLAKIPIHQDAAVNSKTIIGPKAAHPIIIETPIIISHMSFGALSRETKIALAKGSARQKTAICSGEGGLLEDELKSSYKYIFEYVPNRYSVTDENLRRVDGVEIKFGQSSKPGLGGELPAAKVTEEIARVRGKTPHQDITSPPFFDDIKDREGLKRKVDWLREKTGGKPVGIKLAAGNVEADLEIAVYARPDFITIDARPGGTGASPKFVNDSTSLPTLFALHRARKYLDRNNITGITLIITGGLRISPDFAKALALGADVVAIATAALIACGCRQYRLCHTGKCPMGITTQDPELRARLSIENSAKMLENFLRVSTEELKDFARLTGNTDVHKLSIKDLCTTNSEISEHTDIEHV